MLLQKRMWSKKIKYLILVTCITFDLKSVVSQRFIKKL